MGQFIITLKNNEAQAREVLQGWQFMVYRKRMKAFLNLIEFKLRKYPKLKYPDMVKFIEFSDNMIYLKEEKDKLDDFLNQDAASLAGEKNREFNRLYTDRIIQLVASKLRHYTVKAKEKVISAALGEGDVYTFFATIGITIETEIIKE